MSLPDTVFIFVLALIIFGPKKLPEIGRQLGKLVGEFRRASNEFKFQIEEELRQADLNDKRSQQTIGAQSRDVSRAMDTLSAPLFPASNQIAAEALPVGQHPNIDNLNQTELQPMLDDTTTQYESPQESARQNPSVSSQSSEKLPVIEPAEGSLARTTIPYAQPVKSVNGNEAGEADPDTHNGSMASSQLHESVHSQSSAAETEIAHG